MRSVSERIACFFCTPSRCLSSFRVVSPYRPNSSPSSAVDCDSFSFPLRSTNCRRARRNGFSMLDFLAVRFSS